MNRLSGGGFISYALARVIAPTGTDVTLTSSHNTSKTITADKSKMLQTNVNYSVYYFNVGTAEFGNCVITGVHGDYTMSKIVNISSTVEYTVELSHRCPSGYQEVEYITIPKKAYIITNTNIPGTNLYNIELEWCERESSSAWRPMFGGAGGDSMHIAVHSSSGGVTINGWSGSNGATGTCTTNTWINWKWQRNAANTSEQAIVTIIAGNTVKIDSNVYGNQDWGPGFITFNSMYDVADGTYSYNDRSWRKCLITERASGRVVMDIIPCYRISDNVVGIFDTVTEQFFFGTGSGIITAGPAV